MVDEASLTGESDPIKKSPGSEPWCRSGTAVSEGSGHMLVTAVGVQSEWGKTMALVGARGQGRGRLEGGRMGFRKGGQGGVGASFSGSGPAVDRSGSVLGSGARIFLAPSTSNLTTPTSNPQLHLRRR